MASAPLSHPSSHRPLLPTPVRPQIARQLRAESAAAAAAATAAHSTSNSHSNSNNNTSNSNSGTASGNGSGRGSGAAESLGAFEEVFHGMSSHFPPIEYDLLDEDDPVRVRRRVPGAGDSWRGA